MNPELNREYVQSGEDEIFDKMVELTIGQMNTSSDGHRLRVQHAKATGCVTAKFQVGADIPADLRHGVFREPGQTFDAIARFSNSQGTIEPDGEGTVRGLAIKLLDVSGARAIQDDHDRTQDFLLVDHPVFLFPNPRAYLDIMSRKSVPLIGKLFAAVHLAIFERDELSILKAMKSKRVASPLEITYWSGSPFWLGDAKRLVGHAVKYSAVPRETRSAPPVDPDKVPSDYLSKAISEHLADREAFFDFKVQTQSHPIRMPVEDVSMEWDEDVSKPITLGSLRIGIQKVDPSGDLEKQCESMSFNPWHALAEHRPMGGINRLRKAVYQASFNHRVGH
ncbi:MAG: catalase family protein [Candidatus Paceibacterota bacterium]